MRRAEKTKSGLKYSASGSFTSALSPSTKEGSPLFKIFVSKLYFLSNVSMSNPASA